MTMGTPFLGGGRAVEPSRVMRIEPRQYYELAAAFRRVAQQVNEKARERIGGLQGLATEAPTAKVVMLGHRWDTACLDLRRFLARNQITFDWLDARGAGPRQRAGRAPLPADGDCPACASPTGRCWSSRQPRELARPPGPADHAAHGRVRHRHHRRRPGRAGRGRVRRLRGPAHGGGRTRGARRAGRHLLADRELPRLPERHLRRRTGQPRAPAGQAPRRGDPGHAQHRRASTRDARASTSTAATWCGPGPLIIATGVSWRRLAIEGFDRLIGKGIYYGAARSEAGATQGLDVHLIGAGNSAGQAAMFFANHARSVTLIVRGDALEKSMSQYLIDAAPRPSRTSGSRCTREVQGRPRRRTTSPRSTSRPRQRRGAAGGLRRPVRLHRRRRGDRVAARRRSRATRAAMC